MAAAADDDGTGDMNTSLRRVHIGYDSDVDDGGGDPNGKSYYQNRRAHSDTDRS